MKMDELLAIADQLNFSITSLGECRIESPLRRRHIKDAARVTYCLDIDQIRNLIASGKKVPAFEKAGPHDKVFHDPAWSRAAIVTCGGLCPGLNDVIKGLVRVLSYDYGVTNIFGIPYGYEGFIPKYQHAPVILDPDVVDSIHEDGGSILGSSRGEQDTGAIVDTLMRMNINLLFCVGGDGTLRGAHDIAEEITRRRLNISVVGIPKTIDNDLSFTDRTFGFETAVYATHEIITCAHNEALGAFRGIGLVKLMGRDSGFIAAYASLANSVVNFCLVPEVKFSMDGENGLLKALERRFLANKKSHAVIVVAEGAGQEFFQNMPERKDASGNVLKNDIGEYLRHKIPEHFKKIGCPVQLKYFDPSYSIRSIPALGSDAIFCYLLAENAVHAAMAGKTDMVVGFHANQFINIPIPLATRERKTIDTESSLWKALLSSTRQDYYFYGNA